MSVLAILAVDRLLTAVDDALEAYLDSRTKVSAMKKWAETNEKAVVVSAVKPRVHLTVEEYELADRGHIVSKRAGEARFRELSGKFPRAWAERYR